MRQIIVSGLIVVDALFLLSLPVQAQKNQRRGETSGCAMALQAAKNKITKGRRVNVVEITKKNEIPQIYKKYPIDRPFSYTFGLSGSGTNSILKSTKMLITISTEIIRNCQTISIIYFGEYPGDNIVAFGITGQNKVKNFPCYDKRDRTLPWGYDACL